MQRSYRLAVRWKITQDTAYADEALRYLNAWSATLKTITGNADRWLAAGIYGYQFANVAEIMRTYSGWARTDFERFQNMMLTIFYPMSRNFWTLTTVLILRTTGRTGINVRSPTFWRSVCYVTALTSIRKPLIIINMVRVMAQGC
nr:alginate lyase family protein [Pectobacterium sp. PL152]